MLFTNDVSVGQAIVLCRLPTLPEGGRPQSAMVCPTKVNRIATKVDYCRAFRLADSAACIAERKVSLMRVW
jgi:hypothetical protein